MKLSKIEEIVEKQLAAQKTWTVWLYNHEISESNAKVIDVVEGFKNESEAKQYGKKAIQQRSDVVDFKTGPGY